MKRKFRITVHGRSMGKWFKIQRRSLWFFWVDVATYIDTAQQAQELIAVMRESE